MKISQIKITPDAYEPFRLEQGHRVGDLLFIFILLGNSYYSG